MPSRALAETNEAERRRWNDARWAAVWPKRERLTDEVTPVLLEAVALQPGERVLDLGCGGGRSSLAAAAIVGAHGRVVGADLSTPLAALAAARAREAETANVEFQVLDLQTDAVAGAPFDAALSQFGVMFFDEPVSAFRNIRAQLRPGGRIAFACWQRAENNPWFFAAAISELLPPPPPPPPGKSEVGPFALAEPERAEAILREAGFDKVSRSEHEFAVEAPPDALVDDVQLELMGIPIERIASVRAAVDAHMSQFVLRPGLSRFPLAFQIFAAANP